MRIITNYKIFDKYAKEYDEWFDTNRCTYESEVRAIKKCLPEYSYGLDIGTGTGRFAVPLGIKTGVEPAKAMAEIAKERGIEICKAKAGRLPFIDSAFDLVMIVVTICFVQYPVQTLREAKRVLKPGGFIVIGIIDRESFLGKLYESKQAESKFYRHANLYSAIQVLDWLKNYRFECIKTCQTIFKLAFQRCSEKQYQSTQFKYGLSKHKLYCYRFS